jgi:uncharacterized protein with PIN domain
VEKIHKLENKVKQCQFISYNALHTKNEKLVFFIKMMIFLSFFDKKLVKILYFCTNRFRKKAMLDVSIRCYAELNNCLDRARQYMNFPLSIPDGASTSDLITAIGLRPDQIDLILVNGQSAGMNYRLSDKDRIAFYPVFERLDISSLEKIHEIPLRRPRFILDVHLGKLARLLRLLGFDALYRNDYTRDELIQKSIDEHRILLSKDEQLLKDELITHANLIRSPDPHRQINDLLQTLDLFSLAAPFTRCTLCNSMLHRIEKESVLFRIPTMTSKICDEYLLCPSCDHIYWKGTHYKRLESLVREILGKREG